MSESSDTRELCKLWTNQGASCIALVGQGGGQPAGLPDRLILYRGVHFFVEFKAVDGELTTLQRLTIDALRSRGGAVCLVVRCLPHCRVNYAWLDVESGLGGRLQCTADKLLEAVYSTPNPL
jgi:hypothetical protein